MKKNIIYLFLLVFGFVSLAQAQETVDNINSSSELISFMKSDIPRDAPKFSDYPSAIYKGKPKNPDVKSHPRSAQYRTSIRDAAKAGVSFAGHYSIASWNCGAGCTGIAFVDVQSGAVYHPLNLETTSNWNLATSDLTEDEVDSITALNYRANSNLLVVMGRINEESKPLGISYFKWQDNKLKLIRFVPLKRKI